MNIARSEFVMKTAVHRFLVSFLGLCLLLASPPAKAAADSLWQLQLREGAGGLAGSDAGYVTKTNGIGTMDLVWSRTFTVKSNGNYIVRMPYHSEDATLANLLLLRYSYDTNDVLKLDVKNDGFGMWTGQSLMRNSPPGAWDARYCTVHADRDGEIMVHALLYGNPCAVRLGPPAIEDYKTIPPQFKDYTNAFSEDQVRAALARRPAGTARVGRHNGRQSLFINDKPVPAVIYKGVNATRSHGDYASFAGQGIDIATVCIATGERPGGYQCDTDPVWLGRDAFALDRIDAALLRALRRNPNARLILDIRIEPYKAWGTEHPGEIVRNVRGERAYGPCSYVGSFTGDTNLVDPPQSGKWWYPSWQSEVWRADLERVFTRIAEHIKTSAYGKAVVGFFITGNDDGQFVVHYHDHSEPAQQAFRTWLNGKYGTLENLNAVWKTGFTNLAQVQVPPQEWRSDITHYAPGPQPDFREFKERNPWEVRERLAAALKRAMGRPVVAMAYAAPYYHALVDCPHLDAVGMQADYAHRRNGYPIGFNSVCADDVGDRLLFSELDLRSNTGEAWAASEVYREWVSVPSDARAWRSIHRKVAGISLANGYADWYYDMGQYFNDPQVHDEIGAVRRVRERLLETPRGHYRPDVCVVVSETDRHYLAHDEAVIPYDEVNFNPQWLALAASGVPHERHYLKDILARRDLQRFKMYVFLQNAFISEEQRRDIGKKLLNHGRTAVWIYNSGLISEKGKSVEALSALTGIRIQTEEKVARRTMTIEVPGVKPFGGGSEMYWQIFNWGAPGLEVFRVADPQATPLARFAETGQVVAARKDMPGWTSIYIGAAQGLTDDWLNQLARQAGAYVAGPPGQQLNLSGEFASIHALRAGNYTLRIPPGRQRVLDADTGRLLHTGVGEFTFSVQVGETYWFLFK